MLKNKYLFLNSLETAIVVFSMLVMASISISDELPKTLWSISAFGEDNYFYQPSDIEVDYHRSMIYIVDTGSHCVFVFDFQGKFLGSFGNEGQGPGELSRPTGLHVKEDSSVVIADKGNNRIQTFDSSWKFVDSINTKSVEVADLIIIQDKIYTIWSYGRSGFSLNMGNKEDTQPLVNVLDKNGDVIRTISVVDFPETQPFLRAIKHRVCLTRSQKNKLYLPYFISSLIQVFDLEGSKLDEFNRPLPFKPIEPKIIRKGRGEGYISMQATLDMVTQDAKIGPDGNLFLLTNMESSAKRQKKQQKDDEQLPPPAMRIEMIDPAIHKVLRYISCDDGTRSFALLKNNSLVYIFEDSEGELHLKCIRY
jgi:DNA-binding beta-propeller fold protein YncE